MKPEYNKFVSVWERGDQASRTEEDYTPWKTDVAWPKSKISNPTILFKLQIHLNLVR